MLPDSIQLAVVTPERQLIRESVDSVQLPGQDGYLGILPGHAPLITELGVGELSYRKGTETFYATIIQGFAEVLPDRVTILAEVAERAEEIDVERARSARQRAEQNLGKPQSDEPDWDHGTLALQRALVRLQVAAKGGGVAAAYEEQHPAP